jgi:hypothetical protein
MHCNISVLLIASLNNKTVFAVDEHEEHWAFHNTIAMLDWPFRTARVRSYYRVSILDFGFDFFIPNCFSSCTEFD